MSGDLDLSYEPIGAGDEPPSAERSDRASERSRPTGGFVIGAIVAAALVTFGFQNTASVPIRFLWLDGAIPLWLAMAWAALATAAAFVILLGAPARKRRRQRRKGIRTGGPVSGPRAPGR